MNARETLFETIHSSMAGGAGIGLSLCRSIVEAHGGPISAEAPGQGAEMAFSLTIDGVPDAG